MSMSLLEKISADRQLQEAVNSSFTKLALLGLAGGAARGVGSFYAKNTIPRLTGTAMVGTEGYAQAGKVPGTMNRSKDLFYQRTKRLRNRHGF